MSGAGTAFQKAPQTRLPYKSIDDPEFVAASAAHFLSDGDRLIGITSGQIVPSTGSALLEGETGFPDRIDLNGFLSDGVLVAILALERGRPKVQL